MSDERISFQLCSDEESKCGGYAVHLTKARATERIGFISFDPDDGEHALFVSKESLTMRQLQVVIQGMRYIELIGEHGDFVSLTLAV